MDFLQNIPLHIAAALKRPSDDTPITVSTITFALDENGQQVLVDGQHRLQAAVTADWTGEWTIRCLWHSGYTAYHIYTVLDTAQSQRTAAGYDQFSNRSQNAVIAAARYQNVWRTDYSIPPFCSNPPVRDNIARANDRILAFEKADQIIHDNRATSHRTGSSIPVQVCSWPYAQKPSSRARRSCATNRESTLPIRKYRARAVCLACNKRATGQVTIVVSDPPEDSQAERAFILHDDCQNTLVRDIPYQGEPDYPTIADGQPSGLPPLQ